MQCPWLAAGNQLWMGLGSISGIVAGTLARTISPCTRHVKPKHHPPAQNMNETFSASVAIFSCYLRVCDVSLSLSVSVSLCRCPYVRVRAVDRLSQSCCQLDCYVTESCVMTSSPPCGHVTHAPVECAMGESFSVGSEYFVVRRRRQKPAPIKPWPFHL